jgi:hypothetical protein
MKVEKMKNTRNQSKSTYQSDKSAKRNKPERNRTRWD